MKTRTNAEWLVELRTPGEAQAAAIADLREFLLRTAYYSLYRSRSNLAHLDRTSIEQLAEDTAQEALLAILKHLDEFRSESKFSTWAYKFAINFALVAARREHWKDISLDEFVDRPLPDPVQDQRSSTDPRRAALQSEARAVLEEIIAHELTERQREALTAIVFNDVPLDEAGRRWGLNRNATYKLLHDARRKLKARLQARGYELQDLLEIFGAQG